MEPRKLVDKSICIEAVGTQTQRTALWTQRKWGRKENVECMQRVTWELTLSYVKYIANGDLLCDSGNSDWDSVSV